MTGAGAKTPLRILIAALGGEGGGVLMNWIVGAARAAGHASQATSIPGVAQRTGSTSYYIEVAREKAMPAPVFGLRAMPARVDVLVSSELVETARIMAAGFVSPDLTTLISSTTRVLATAEKIELGDGRYDAKNILSAAKVLAKDCFFLDLGKIAAENDTFVSATMFGALAASGVLPWATDISRNQLTDPNSLAGFDAASSAAKEMHESADLIAPEQDPPARNPATQADVPPDIQAIIDLGKARCAEFQDAAYASLYLARVERLIAATDQAEIQTRNALNEACRRLALWMAFEDVARVADLKTRAARFEGIRADIKLQPGQLLKLSEYMKPRAEEVADILPVAIGARIMARVERGKGYFFLGRGIRVRSNGVFGYWTLRAVASLKRIRRKSLRYTREQAAIERWMKAMELALNTSPAFAEGLAELPRVLKGYSDTLMRGKAAYDAITEAIVDPAIANDFKTENAALLRTAIGAALADDRHEKLHQVLAGETVTDEPIPNLGTAGSG